MSKRCLYRSVYRGLAGLIGTAARPVWKVVVTWSPSGSPQRCFVFSSGLSSMSCPFRLSPGPNSDTRATVTTCRCPCGQSALEPSSSREAASNVCIRRGWLKVIGSTSNHWFNRPLKGSWNTSRRQYSKHNTVPYVEWSYEAPGPVISLPSVVQLAIVHAAMISLQADDLPIRRASVI